MTCGNLCSECASFGSCGTQSGELTPLEREMLPRLATASRGLVMDMIAEAKSGHLGMALGCAEIGAVLFGKWLRITPENPRWLDRDRFVLSAGHASAFLYSWLHLSGFPFSTDDLRHFRKENSSTPGHPEFNPEHGIECTTGPLGQGIANAVGIALSQKMLAAKASNQDRFQELENLFQGKVYCLAGDGCMQEGIALEALQLAGHWRLDNLILIYDANQVTLDGPLSRSQSTDIAQMLHSFGWETQNIDGNNIEAIHHAIAQAHTTTGKPQAIIAHTLIGKGIPHIEGSSLAHGGEKGIPDIPEAKQALGILGEPFQIDASVSVFCDMLEQERSQIYQEWCQRFGLALESYPELQEILFPKHLSAEEFLSGFPEFQEEKISTREASGRILNLLAKQDPFIISGSADLFSSAKNYLQNQGDFSAEQATGRNLFFGIREHAMGGILNGIAYDGIFLGLGSTFLVFSDYLRPSIRVAALSHLPVNYLFSHDSLAVGEDGPTHQPVETLPSLRLISRLEVIRPADAEETVGAYARILQNAAQEQNQQHPIALILSRQNLKNFQKIPANTRRMGSMKGGYVFLKESAPLEMIIIASGSEVEVATEFAESVAGCRVVSMPCREYFEQQSQSYREEVLPSNCKNIFVLEAARGMGWEAYTNRDKIFSVEDFGASENGTNLLKKRGISVEAIREKCQQLKLIP